MFVKGTMLEENYLSIWVNLQVVLDCFLNNCELESTFLFFFFLHLTTDFTLTCSFLVICHQTNESAVNALV